ncbi:hypothetical protein ACFFQF_29980 [Haladaptatus pallidirubidus]|uniref:DUF7835 family putative zinc beta-ribbon protein n=1 Tax=Haladaptatus pallidirubidus TaxID=1008152 RepID=UPI001D0FA989|nr:hypothetical protein [Haladaptatus pallidirubidus]
MGRNYNSENTIAERCEICGRETSHDVAIVIKTESKKAKNAEFSREPYRTSQCQVCGSTHSQRMNNA